MRPLKRSKRPHKGMSRWTLWLASVALAGAVLGTYTVIAKTKEPADKPNPPAQNAPEATAPSGVAAPARTPAELEAPIEVEETAFATAIASMTPVGKADAFDASVGTVYFWNRIKLRNPPTTIKHVWYRDNILMGESAITLRYKRSRAWTHRQVKPGQWKVVVADVEGKPIFVAVFPVRPEPRTAKDKPLQ